MKTYFAIVHEDKDSAVGVVFPDLPGCFSAGDTFDAAIVNAGKALRLHAEAERAAGRTLPKPSSFAELYGDREIRREAQGAPFVGIQLEDTRRERVEGKPAAMGKSPLRSGRRSPAGRRPKRATS